SYHAEIQFEIVGPVETRSIYHRSIDPDGVYAGPAPAAGNTHKIIHGEVLAGMMSAAAAIAANLVASGCRFDLQGTFADFQQINRPDALLVMERHLEPVGEQGLQHLGNLLLGRPGR